MTQGTGDKNVDNKEQAQIEYEKLRRWVLDEEDKAVDRLKDGGRYTEGLDGNHEELSYIYEERNRRIKEIKEKYNV